MDRQFFQLILNKVFNTTVVTTSLIIYSKRDKRLIILGVLTGFLINIMIHVTSMRLNNGMQLINSVCIALLSTRIGQNMLQKRRDDVSARLTLLLLPTCFMINQGLGVSPQHEAFLMTVYSVVLCGVFGLAYYFTLTHFSRAVQTAGCSIVVYLTGAIAVSKVFGSVEQIIHPPIKSLVLIIREQSAMNDGSLIR